MNGLTEAPRFYPQIQPDLPYGNCRQVCQKGIRLVKEIALLIKQGQLGKAANQSLRIVITLVSAAAIKVKELINRLAVYLLSLTDEQSRSAEAAPNLPDETRSLNVHEMSPEALKAVFDQLSTQDLSHLKGLSEELMVLVDQPALWNLWAERLCIPIENGEDPRTKIAALLTYFNTDPVTGKATLLKNIEHVKAALEIYPSPAWIIQPIANSTRLNFYCHHQTGKYIEYVNVDKDIFHSEQTQKVNIITEDGRYTHLTGV